MLDMGDGLFEQLTDVVVVQVIDNAASIATTDHESQMPEHSQLVGYGGGLHADDRCELVDRAGAAVQPAEDPQPARRGKGLHRLGDRLCKGGVELGRFVLVVAVSHAQQNS
jgi:hypothetical protein